MALIFLLFAQSVHASSCNKALGDQLRQALQQKYLEADQRRLTEFETVILPLIFETVRATGENGIRDLLIRSASRSSLSIYLDTIDVNFKSQDVQQALPSWEIIRSGKPSAQLRSLAKACSVQTISCEVSILQGVAHRTRKTQRDLVIARFSFEQNNWVFAHKVPLPWDETYQNKFIYELKLKW